jgi:DNA-binding IclR family transcriptional regulator
MRGPLDIAPAEARPDESPGVSTDVPADAAGHVAGDVPGTVIQSVVVAGRVLEALAAASKPMRLTELANQLGEVKARIHRHLTTLKRIGLVDQDRTSERYRLGWKLVNLGQAAADQFEIRRIAEPYMLKLRDLAQQTVVLSVPANGEAMVVAVMDSPTNLVTISVRQGARLPAHASAQGRIVLAFAPSEVQNRFLQRKLARLTPRTITDPTAIRSHLARIREQLYELAPGETLLGITTLAAPLLDHEGQLLGVIAIVGSEQFIPDPVDAEQVRLVRACAAAISGEFSASTYLKAGILPAQEFSRHKGG